jgi:hypothetical protein
MSTLNVNDLAMIVNIIDLSSERGVFKGPDLKTVGDLRERLVEFVKQVTAENKEQANESTSEQPK